MRSTPASETSSTHACGDLSEREGLMGGLLRGQSTKIGPISVLERQLYVPRFCKPGDEKHDGGRNLRPSPVSEGREAQNKEERAVWNGSR